MCVHKIGDSAKNNLNSLKDVPIKNLFKLIYNCNYSFWKKWDALRWYRLS